MTNQAYPGKEPSSTCGAEVGWGRDIQTSSSSLAHLTFLAGMLKSLVLCYLGSFSNGAAPEGAISGKCLPGICVNGKFLEVDLQVVFEALLLTSNLTLTIGEFAIE